MKLSGIVLLFRSKGSGRCGVADSRATLVVSPLVWFSYSICDDASSLRNHQAERWSCGNHGSIWDSCPLLFLVIREGLWSGVRLGTRGTTRLTLQLRLALEPECLKYRSNHRGDWNHGMERNLWEHSSCLWVQITGVEASSFLPDGQDNRCDFACQAQPCDLGPYSFADLSSVKPLKWSTLDRGNG